MLKRINTTPTTPVEFMGDHLISNMSMAIIHVAVIGFLSFLMGYRPDRTIAGMVLAFLFIFIFSLTSIGFGLITATIAKNPKAAGGDYLDFYAPATDTCVGFIPITPFN